MRLLDYHDSGVKVTNSAFYSNNVMRDGPPATSNIICC